MSKKFVIPVVPNAAARSIGGNSDHNRCFIVFFAWFVSTRAIFWSLAILFCLSSVDVRGADERLKAAEHRALIAAANTESAYLQRANIELIAPEVQRQVQDLADEISLGAGTDRHFKVFIVNDGYLFPQSSANGDIFVTTGYLDMAENRDELAFGLAREIALQVKDLRLKEMEQQLADMHKANRINLALGVVVSGTLGAIYSTYALAPIQSAIYRNTATPTLIGIQTVAGKSTVTAGRGPGGLITVSSSGGPHLEGIGGPDFTAWGNALSATKTIDQFVDWLPNLINSKIQAITTHLVTVAFEDKDPERRKLKNQLGLTFMRMAGYDSASGLKVIKKIDDYVAYASTTNAPANNVLK